MPFVAGSITGTIGLDADPAMKAFRQVQTGAETLHRRATGEMNAMASESENRFKDMLENIRGQAGKRSVFGESVELLAGGGVIGGFAIAADKFYELAEQADKFSISLRQGNTDFGSMVGDIVRSVPVFGSLVKGSESLLDTLTGDKAAFMGIDKIYDSITSKVELWDKKIQQLAVSTARLADQAVRFRDAAEVGAHPGERPLADFRSNEASLRAQTPFAAQIADPKDLQNKIDAQRKLVDAAQAASAAALKQAETLRNGINYGVDVARSFGNPGAIAQVNAWEEAEKKAAGAMFDANSAAKELNYLQNLLKASTAYRDALSEAHQLLGQGLSKEGIGEFAPSVKWFREQLDSFKKLGARAMSQDGSEGSADWSFEQLPNARVPAEEIFGTRGVTSADLPPKYISDQLDEAKQTSKNTAKTSETLQEMLPALRQAAVTLIINPP